MKLSKTSEYALRVMSFMINSDKQVFSAKYLLDNLNMPDKYFRALMTKLSKAGFITSIKGRDGGYVFSKNADKIFLADIIDAVEGMDKYEGCILGFKHCSENKPCALHEKWGPIRAQVLSFLRTTSLAELKNKDKIERF